MYDSLDTWYCMLLNMAEITEVELITFSKPDRKKDQKKLREMNDTTQWHNLEMLS